MTEVWSKNVSLLVKQFTNIAQCELGKIKEFYILIERFVWLPRMSLKIRLKFRIQALFHALEFTLADSFISIEFEEDGVGSWETGEVTKVSLEHCTPTMTQNQREANKSVVEQVKPHGLLRWRKRQATCSNSSKVEEVQQATRVPYWQQGDEEGLDKDSSKENQRIKSSCFCCIEQGHKSFVRCISLCHRLLLVRSNKLQLTITLADHTCFVVRKINGAASFKNKTFKVRKLI